MVIDMTTTDSFRPDAVLLDLPARTKAEVLKALATRAAVIANRSPEALHRALAEREVLGSTGVGFGVALPHATIADLPAPVVLFARLARSLDWQAIDDRPVDLVLAVLSPVDGMAPGARALASYARCLRREESRALLRHGGETDVAAALTTAAGERTEGLGRGPATTR